MFFAAVAGFAVRFRWLVVLGWLAVAVAAMLALPGLGSEANSDPSLFLPAAAPSVQAATLASPLLGSVAKSKITIVAARASGPLTAADLAAASRVAGLARQVSGVLGVRAGAISPDGHAAEIDVTAGHAASDVVALKPIVRHLGATLASANPPAGLQLHLAGPVASDAASNASGTRATGRIGLFAVVFIVLALLILLRSPVAALVTFLPSVAALLVSGKFIAGLGAHGLQISSVTQTLLVVLLLGAGTDYGLFLIYRFREERRAGTGPQQAVVLALTRVGASITASAGTVVLALLTLLLATFGLYRDLAVPLALGIVVMLLAGLTLLPALLALTAGWMFQDGAGPGRGGQAGWWGRVTARAVRRPAVLLGAGLLVFAALALAAFGYRTANVAKSAAAPAGSDAALGNALVATYFSQSTASPASLILRYDTPVWQQPGPLQVAAASLRSSRLFGALAGPLNANGSPLAAGTYARLHAALGNPRALPLAEPASARVPRAEYNAYRATAQFVSGDGRTVRFAAALRAGNQQSTAAMNATPAVRAALTTAARRSGAVASGVTGRAASLYDVSSVAGRDMVRIIPVAVLAIAVLLGVVLRSLIAPLYLVASILLSFLAALGLTTLLAINLGGQDGLIFVLPFLMFVFLLALGEDYNILVMTRIREEAARLPLREAVVAAIARTGPAITAAGLILAGTFGVFAVFGGGVMGGQLQPVGLGLALGILLDTFGVRTLLVPAAAVLLGRWNWWPSRLGRPVGGPAASVARTPVASDNAG